LQCPNCNKEAINVNGKYVCLDCGIEINPTDQTKENIVAPDPIVNHATGDASNNSPVVAQDDSSAASDTRQAPTSPSPIPESSVVESASQADDFVPVSPAAPVDMNPVKDEFMKELEIPASQSFTDVPASDSAMGGATIPDFPIGTTGPVQSEPAINQTPTEDLVVPVEEPTPVVSSEPTAETVSQEVSVSPAPESYFQPGSVDITPNNQPASVENSSFDAMSTPSGIGVGEPMVEELPSTNPPAPMTTVTPDFPTMEQAAATNPEPVAENPIQPSGASLDELLDSATPAPTAPDDLGASYTNTPSQSAPMDTIQPSINQAFPDQNQVSPGQIPSYESVFGTEDNNNPKPQAMESGSNKANVKKIMIIVGAVILGLGLVSGIIFAVLSVTSNRAPKDPVIDQVTLSKNVQDSMETDINAEVVYEQTIDFSGANLTATAQNDTTKTLATAPTTNKGNWQINQSGDISYDAVVNGTSDKKIYLEGEKATYTLNKSTNTWDKKTSPIAAVVPVLYGYESRGKLFYNNQSESITKVGAEEVDGVSCVKYQIVPKPVLVQTMLISSNSALTSAKIESVDASGLTIYAWLDDQNRIKKVSATGDVVVKADIFEGEATVSIDSTATYTYKDELIIKSPLSVNEISPVRATQATQQIDKEVKPTVIPASTVVEEPSGRG